MMVKICMSGDMCQDEIAPNMFTFFVGGTETTANYAGMCIYCLAKYPDWQDRIY